MKLGSVKSLLLAAATCTFSSQSLVAQVGHPCAIVSCPSSTDYPLRVMYVDSDVNPVGQCFGSFTEALHVFQGLVATGQCFATTPQSCSIVSCNNVDFPFRVVFADTSINPTGTCVASFDEAFAQFRGLQQTGQCY